MKEFNKGKKQSEFMSTHPSPDNRIKRLMNGQIILYLIIHQ